MLQLDILTMVVESSPFWGPQPTLRDVLPEQHESARNPRRETGGDLTIVKMVHDPQPSRFRAWAKCWTISEVVMILASLFPDQSQYRKTANISNLCLQVKEKVLDLTKKEAVKCRLFFLQMAIKNEPEVDG